MEEPTATISSRFNSSFSVYWTKKLSLEIKVARRKLESRRQRRNKHKLLELTAPCMRDEDRVSSVRLFSSWTTRSLTNRNQIHNVRLKCILLKYRKERISFVDEVSVKDGLKQARLRWFYTYIGRNEVTRKSLLSRILLIVSKKDFQGFTWMNKRSCLVSLSHLFKPLSTD